MILDYEVHKDDNMSTSASTLLRIIQNNSTANLDLLTRECIQNSIDAALEKVKSVDIDINTGKFDTYYLNQHFGDFGAVLYEAYKKEIDNKIINSFISFSDKNTTGLTGPINKQEEKASGIKDGKFMKLVFKIGKAQSVVGSGGSWGYGKTVYYRIGIGLVIFYTRIKVNDEYKSRLIMTFVEDENNGRIIPKIDKENENTGIVWFGEKINGNIAPLVDEKKIYEIMSVFGLPLYKGNETGTTVIIPYIDEQDLLTKTYYNNKDDDYNKPYWCESIDEYLRVAAQRWYAPRLMNPNYRNGPYIKLTVNKQILNPTSFLFTFQTIQQLYNYQQNEWLSNGNIEINKADIKLRDSFDNNTLAGTVYYTRVEKSNLSSKEDLYKQIRNNKEFSNDVNLPIITFCRKPGMLLRYDVGESWSNRIENDENHYIVGLFVSNSDENLIVKGMNCSLEEYLRSSELADHFNWNDVSNFNIIKKIQANIQTKINNTYVQKEAISPTKGVGSLLGRKLTELFLPTIGYGKRANARKKNIPLPKRGSTNTPKSISRLTFLPKTIRKLNDKKLITEDFVIALSRVDRLLKYEICIESEDNAITLNTWKNHISSKNFPLEIEKLEVLSYETEEGLIYPIRFMLNNIVDNLQNETINMNKLVEDNQWNGWIININNKNIININCRLTYKYLDNKYLCSVIRQKENVNE